MSFKTKRERVVFSKLRKDLLGRAEEFLRICKLCLDDSAIIRGSVCQVHNKCGKKNCACTKGRLHPRNLLSDKRKGKTILQTIPSGRLVEVKIKVNKYKKLRQVRARLGKLYREMLELIDEIESMRREEMKR